MSSIVLGLGLWMLVHFSPRLVPQFKIAVVDRIGNLAYRGGFSLLVLCALMLIIIGWRNTPVELLYTPIPALRHLAILIMLIAFILVGSSKAPVRIKRYIRHPMLWGVVLWAIAHLLANGETRAVVLFTGMGIWALIQMLLINKHTPQYEKPVVDNWAREVKVLIISVIMMLLVMYLHVWFTGVALFHA